MHAGGFENRQRCCSTPRTSPATPTPLRSVYGQTVGVGFGVLAVSESAGDDREEAVDQLFAEGFGADHWFAEPHRVLHVAQRLAGLVVLACGGEGPRFVGGEPGTRDLAVAHPPITPTPSPPADRRLPATRRLPHGGDHMPWQTTGPVALDAPTVRVARSGADVVIRHYTAGTHRDLCLRLVVWFGVVRAIHAGRLDRIGEAWMSLTASDGRARLRDGRVELGYGYLHQRTATLPAPVWRALAAAARAGTLDQLPHADHRELTEGLEPAGERAGS